MFDLPVDDRLSLWADHRASIDSTQIPFELVIDFWKNAPYVPYNRHVDAHHRQSWPTPWEIIVENKYDDFTKALMIAYSLKFTNRFKESVIKIHCLIDNETLVCYNVVCVDDAWCLNYKDDGVIHLKNIPDSFLVENIIEVGSLR